MKKGKRYNIVKRNIALSILLGMFLNSMSFANSLIKTRDGSTARVITAPNGTPMIELANPNGNRISVNDFEWLNVEERNLILINLS